LLSQTPTVANDAAATPTDRPAVLSASATTTTAVRAAADAVS